MDQMNIHTLPRTGAANRSLIVKIVEGTGDAGRPHRFATREALYGSIHHIAIVVSTILFGKNDLMREVVDIHLCLDKAQCFTGGSQILFSIELPHHLSPFSSLLLTYFIFLIYYFSSSGIVQ